MHPESYFFYQTNGSKTWSHAPASERNRITKDKDPAFVTALDVYHDFEKDPEPGQKTLSYSGDFYADFDGGEGDDDLEATIAEVQKFIVKLGDLGIDLDQLRFFASGKKGFHVEIPAALFMEDGMPPEGIANLPKIYNDMAEALYVDTLDLSVYSGRKGRMWRVPNRKREDNKAYKVQVTAENIFDMTPEKYRQLVAQPRSLSTKDAPTFVPALAKLFEECKAKVEAYVERMKLVKVVPDAELKRLFPNDPLPPSLLLLAQGKIATREGTGWNKIVMQLAIAAVHFGTSEDDLIKVCSQLIQKHRGDGSRYSTPHARERELRKQWSYMQDREYGFSTAAIRDILPPEGQYPDLDKIEKLEGGGEGESGGELDKLSNKDRESVKRFAALSPMEQDRFCKDEAKGLGIRQTTLRRLAEMVKGTAKGEETSGSAILFPPVEPWPEPVAGDQLLSDIAATITRFIVCKPETAHTATLWVAMTWLIDTVDTAPLAVITAPEKRCGKSQLLTVLGRLSCQPMVASNISPAALFRVIDNWQPTLLIDEADAFMRGNEELRGILNSGHKRDSAYVVRTVGEDFTTKQFSTWGAKAIAGIGHLADTLMDRAIILGLRRKLPHENVERLRQAEPGLFDTLSAKLSRWSEDNREAIRRARPDLPARLNDRAQDNWEPLLAIANVAGGIWPEQARQAALSISKESEESGSLNVGTELLADIQEIFETRRVDRISTAELIEALCADDEKSWATYNQGKPIRPRQVAKRLKEYGIRSKNVRIGYEVPKGFEKSQFQDAFMRYLIPGNLPLHATNQQISINHAGFSVADSQNASATLPLHATEAATEIRLPGGGTALRPGGPVVKV
jgi:putative DNA primase/helicase